MASNIAKAAAVGALAMNGGGGGESSSSPDNAPRNDAARSSTVPECPAMPLAEYHQPDVCLTKPSRPSQGDESRRAIYNALRTSEYGASLVPNMQTVTCPLEVQSLENPSATRGFDTTWIVENTSTAPAVVAWVVNGMEYSPFQADMKAMDDPKAILKPGDWTSVPTFESFVYHVREIEEDGTAGNVVLQHRAGLVPVGNPHDYPCDASKPDVEPFDPDTGARKQEFRRTPTHQHRPCNTIDVGFRNQVGCPLHVYWANQLSDENVPDSGFNCGEKFKFHLGTKPSPQDFFEDWNSMTKFEGSYIGHTFVARLASDPTVVIDKYTLEPTRIIDCPNLKQKVQVTTKEEVAEAIIEAQGNILPLEEPGVGDNAATGAAASAAAGGVSG